MDQRELTVGELARETHTTVATLHYYDKHGLLTPRRLPNGRRVYGEQELLRLEQILLLKMLGFSLEEIRDRILPVADAGQICGMMERQLTLLNQHIRELEQTQSTIGQILENTRHTGRFEWQKCLLLLRELPREGRTNWMIHFFTEENIVQAVKATGSKEALLHTLDASQSMLDEMQGYIDRGMPPECVEAQALTGAFLEMLEPFFDITIMTTPYDRIVRGLGDKAADLPPGFQALSDYFVRCTLIYYLNKIP